MGGGSDPAPSGSTTVTNTSAPPAYVEGPASRFLGRAEELSNTPYSTYEGERIAPLTAQHQQGIAAASNPSALNAANQYLTGLYSQDQPNPYLDAAFNRGAGAIESRFLNSAIPGASGMSNSGLQSALGQQINSFAEDLYGGDYQQQQGRRMQGLQAAAQLPQAQAQLAFGAGDVLRGYDQDRINDAIRAFEEQRLYPFQQLDVLGSAIGSSMGGGFGTTTQQQPYYETPSSVGMLGGGLLGAELLSKFAS